VKPRSAEGYRQVREVYDMVPEVVCKGLCHDTCTSVGAAPLERAVIRERHGVELGPAIPSKQLAELDDRGEAPRCPALSALNTCSVYQHRPLICRLYGADAGLPCAHGCVPARGGWLDTDVGTEMIGVVELISRVHGH
jgi:hypothetical protein